MGRYSNGLSALFKAMEPNQALFVQHLRTNPHNVVQVTGTLVEDDKSMCALGLGLEAFGMIRAYKESQNQPYSIRRDTYNPYKEIASKLNMPQRHVEQVYALNDDHGLTFSEIADVMEEYFTKGNLFAWDASGPEDIYENRSKALRDKKRDDFVLLWEKHKAKYQKLMEEAANDFGVSTYDVLTDGIFEVYTGKEFFDEVVNEENDW